MLYPRQLLHADDHVINDQTEKIADVRERRFEIDVYFLHILLLQIDKTQLREQNTDTFFLVLSFFFLISRDIHLIAIKFSASFLHIFYTVIL